MAESNTVAGQRVLRFSWLKNFFPYLRGASIGVRSKLGRHVALDDSSSVAQDGSVNADEERTATRSKIELTAMSMAKWLEKTAMMKLSIAEAQARVARQMATIQASIIFAQDNLSEDDDVARQALRRKIECAEKCHQKVCQFNRIVDDVMYVAVLTPRLAGIVDALQAQYQTCTIESIPDVHPVDRSQEHAWVTKQLTLVERRLACLGRKTEGVLAGEVAACVASLEAVVKLLTRRINDVGNDFRCLIAMIDELDQFIVFA